MELAVTTSAGVKRRNDDDEGELARRYSNSDKELTKIIGSLTEQLSFLNNEAALLKTQNALKVAADLDRDAILEVKLLAVQEGAAAAAK